MNYLDHGVSTIQRRQTATETDRERERERLLTGQLQAELGYAAPPVPIVFIKANTALNDPSSPIIIPNFVADADFEVELCAVIGKEAKNVTDDEALDYVLGYSTSNDVAARRAQTITSQFCHGKGFDTFAPLGPTLVHAKAIPNPQTLEMRTTLNGKEMQHATLDSMIFPVARIVSHLSQVSLLASEQMDWRTKN